ncbi:MAG: VTC domain-containing protein [Kofleriaceae bacterium]
MASFPPPGLDLDAQLTAHRREEKYLLAADDARAVAVAASAYLRPHRYRGAGANSLPGARHFVTTVYFDTPGRALFDAAQRSERHLKLRAKEYYDLHPDLTETATDPAELVRYQPILWLEIKSRDAGFTGKQRIGLPKVDVPGFFTEGRLSPEMRQIQEAAYGADAHAALAAVATLCNGFAEPLQADCLVNYRRQAWQDELGQLRLTLDHGLGMFRPPADLWARRRSLVRETLGTPVATEARRVLEVKTRGPAPGWLRDVLDARALTPVDFSKFAAASIAVHG